MSERIGASPSRRAGLLVALTLAACYRPAPEDGALLCDDDRGCPGGYHCAVDYTCWRDGREPRGDAAAPPPPDFSDGKVRDLATADLPAVADAHGPRDLAPADLLPAPDLTPAALGVPCGKDGDCSSGMCTDGVCCAERKCQLQCTSCAAGRGLTCAQVTVGVLDPRGLCKDDKSSCQRATCDGKGGCQSALAGVPCADATCANATFTPARTCDGKSLGCPMPMPAACANQLVCADPVSCLVMCARDLDCVANYCCRNNACGKNDQPGACGPQCLDCAGSAAGHACVAAACGCNGDGDCNGIPGRPRCDVGKHACVACLTSFDCTPIAPLCVAGSCQACGNNNDCINSGWGSTCNAGACSCASKADCRDAGGRAKLCDGSGRCVCGMGNAPCAVGSFCSNDQPSATCQ